MTAEGKLRIFSPIILFHDHEYIKDDCTEHIHIPYGGDPFHHDGQTIEIHKRRISRMLENNGRFWSDIITWSRDHALTTEHSPVPSLVSSPTPPLRSQELPSPSPPPTSHRRHSHHNNKKQPSTAGSVLVATTATTATTITSGGKTNKRRRGNLPKAVTAILRDWLSDHKKHPYPTEEEKDNLARRTGLTLNQISNWFINARRRILQPMLEQEEHQHELDILPYCSPSSDDSLDRRLGKRSAAEAFHRRDSIQKKFNTRRRS
ncbi:uncharacterized protein BX664DRAFT_335200 [Halteromyces radiatus]|uniref:uncharacterized protein n=1 Tax=Halteromyces radiatus TaxID=101107 RepID=UPI002220FB8A|nr:uncharacterized protein BX664DRAFT_335200 [Halteromyces radiatus]KAI8086218.1 hypothetical protein BX664DRAFT_335200 [Halteromyces radiatus]